MLRACFVLCRSADHRDNGAAMLLRRSGLICWGARVKRGTAAVGGVGWGLAGGRGGLLCCGHRSCMHDMHVALAALFGVWPSVR